MGACRAAIVLAFLFCVGGVAETRAQSFMGLGFSPTHTSSFAMGVSGDGTTVVGFSGSHAAKWTSGGGMVDMGADQAIASSTDGGVIVGGSSATGPVKWVGGSTTPTVIPDLPTVIVLLAGQANGVSGDGSKIVGQESFFDHFPPGPPSTTQAFIWTDATGTQPLSGPTGGFAMSVATAISRDGTTVVGQGYTIDTQITHPSMPFYWRDDGTGKHSLGSLATTPPSNNNGFATAVNADGTVIVGGSSSNLTTGVDTEAFRWDAVHGLVGLGDLSGGAFHSLANAVSADGTIIVGNGYDAAGEQAVRWDASNAISTVASYLSANGVSVGTWQLSTATGLSADGRTIVGSGTDPTGATEAWLAYVPPPSGSGSGAGLLGIDNYLGSLGPVERGLGTAALLVRTSGDIAEEVARDYGCGEQNGTCIYGAAGVQAGGDGAGVDPDFGLIHNFGRGLRGGLGVSVQTGGPDLSTGSERTTFAGVQGFFSYDDTAGLEVDASFAAGLAGLTTTRSYLNGATTEAASGSTSGDSEAGALRVGWRFPVGETASFSPFARYAATRVALAGFSETSSGPFPATYAARTDFDQSISLGVDATVHIGRATTLRASAAWRHRVAGSTSPLTAAVPGVITASLTGSSRAADAFDMSVGVTRALSSSAMIGATFATEWAAGRLAGRATAEFSVGF